VTSDSALILAAVSTSANWTTNNNRNLITIGGCSYSCISCPNTVTWDGASWDNVTGPLSNDAASLAGNYNTLTNGSFSSCSLTINSGFSLTIAENNYVEVFTNVINNGQILIQDKGSFVQVDNAAIYDDTGSSFFATDNTAQVTRSTAVINNWYEYTYWSSPVSNENVEDVLFTANPDRRFTFSAANFADLTFETNNNNATTAYVLGDILDDIDDNGDDWQLASGLMLQGVGYAATMSPTSISFFGGPNFDHIFEGTLNNGDIDVAVVRNDASNSSSIVPDNNWNFIGNPYPSAIDVDLFFATNMWSVSNPNATLDGSIYLWSQNSPPSNTNNGNQVLNFSGDYAVINGMGETAGGDMVTPTREISSAQGFFVNFVDTDDRVSSMGNVTFNNAMRVRDNNSKFFKTSQSPTSATEKFRLNLTSDNGVFSQLLVGYNATATNGFDGAYFDAAKNSGSNTPVVFGSSINNNSYVYAIQGKSINSLNENEVMPLAFSTLINVPTIYNISLASIEGYFLTNNTVYLEDSLMNTVHDLSNSDYTFTSAEGEFNDRFKIVFNTSTLSTDSFTTNSNNLSIIELQNDNVKFVYNGDLTIKRVEILDLLGRKIYNFRGSENTQTYNLSNLSNAIYIAQIELSNGQVISKKAVKK
uniref:T9SS type A sorting domain-containing protein n=1 Tax=Lacinutrix sp. TaxID=1937692 RepID=UPI0025C0B9CD